MIPKFIIFSKKFLLFTKTNIIFKHKWAVLTAANTSRFHLQIFECKTNCKNLRITAIILVTSLSYYLIYLSQVQP